MGVLEGFCQSMLLLNAAWDFVSAIAIWLVFCTKDVVCVMQRPIPVQSSGDTSNEGQQEMMQHITAYSIAKLHTSMWTRHEDCTNHAACMLMAWWVITLGCMRLLAAFLWGEWLILAMLSYGIESAAFLGESLKSTMVPKKACPASAFSLLCLVVCAMTYFEKK